MAPYPASIDHARQSLCLKAARTTTMSATSPSHHTATLPMDVIASTHECAPHLSGALSVPSQ